MTMKLFVRFPKGTAGYGTVLRDDMAKRMVEAGKEGALLVHRGDDFFEVFGVSSLNIQGWRKATAGIRKHLPTGKILQIKV